MDPSIGQKQLPLLDEMFKPTMPIFNLIMSSVVQRDLLKHFANAVLESNMMIFAVCCSLYVNYPRSLNESPGRLWQFPPPRLATENGEKFISISQV